MTFENQTLRHHKMTGAKEMHQNKNLYIWK